MTAYIELKSFNEGAQLTYINDTESWMGRNRCTQPSAIGDPLRQSLR